MTGSKKPSIYNRQNGYISLGSDGKPHVHPRKVSLNEDYFYELSHEKKRQTGGSGSSKIHGQGGQSSSHRGSGGSGRSCGDPGCGISHLCQMHYSQAVRPMGYSGYANTPVYQSGGAYCPPAWCARRC